MEQPHGEENNRLHQTASAGGRGQSVAADRSRARPARPQHHGILQGLQCAHRAIGKGLADSGRHHRLPGPLVHLRDAPAAGDLLLEEGRWTQARQEARLRRQDDGPRLRRQGDQGAGARDRPAEDRRPQLRHDRSGDVDDRRLGPLDGPASGGGLTMAHHGKRVLKAREGVERTKLYGLADAVRLVKTNATAKFDETVELSINLGVDPKHADQMVRGVVNLPNGTGRTLRVAVFARGPKADEARAAGADVVGAEDLVAQVQGGEINFDRCIATPDMMPLVGRLGKVLGPRGLMPNPKVGTVTMDVTAAVKGAKGGSVEFRVEKAGIVQAGVGKASFSAEKLVENIMAFADAVQKSRPAGAKGHFINRVAVSSTMGPGVKVEPGSLFASGQQAH